MNWHDEQRIEGQLIAMLSRHGLFKFKPKCFNSVVVSFVLLNNTWNSNDSIHSKQILTSRNLSKAGFAWVANLMACLAFFQLLMKAV